MPRLKVSLKSICLKPADCSFNTIISWTGPKQNKDFIPQELQILFCKFLMKQIVTCQICAERVSFRCSHHGISYTSLIFITRFQNWFWQRETSLPLWKSNSPILMYVNLLYYKEENLFSYQTNYDLVDRSLDSLEFLTWLSCKIKMRKSMLIMHHFSFLFFCSLFVFLLLFLWRTTKLRQTGN